MKGLPPTARQAEVLRLFANADRAGKSAPTVRELCAVLGIVSTNGAKDHLLALAKKGLLLQGAPKKARAWRLTATGWASLGGVESLSNSLRGALVAYEEAVNRAAPLPELVDLLDGLADRATTGAADLRARCTTRRAR